MSYVVFYESGFTRDSNGGFTNVIAGKPPHTNRSNIAPSIPSTSPAPE